MNLEMKADAVCDERAHRVERLGAVVAFQSLARPVHRAGRSGSTGKT